MKPIEYIDRSTGKLETEMVFGGSALQFLYGGSFLSSTVGSSLAYLLAKHPFFSQAVGWWQNQAWTRRNIAPFIQKFNMNSEEFLKSVSEFSSFNDFFIRKLKPDVRPIAEADATMPADARYWFFPDIGQADGFVVKGKKFQLEALLQDADLAKQYAEGSMVLARLCPTDYHRFHFPCNCLPDIAKTINGWLYSVNPIAVRRNIDIYSENKRTLTRLQNTPFGQVLCLEVGATTVGSILQTYKPFQAQHKGAEKGYFSFGGSALVLLFLPQSIVFDPDLLEISAKGFEAYCQMGQSLGKAL